MNGTRQAWLVARRELLERARSKAFLVSLVVMIAVVAGAIALPALLGSGGTKDVGLAGSVPQELPTAIRAQGKTVQVTVRIHRYDSPAAGRQAVRAGDIDVLVVDARRLAWQTRTDDRLQAVLGAAIQLVAVQQRAAAAGISPQALTDLMAPVAVRNVELGHVRGRSPDDETAAFIMTMLLFMTIATYGAMVMTGVVEEKSSRVVEVLLARMPARNLLIGKIVGIGVLGLVQVAVTALAALVAASVVGSVQLPAVRPVVLAWAVGWFVLGYALYATVFGSLGSLASRAEDAQNASGPVSVVLVAGYFVSFASIGSPDALWARLVSFFPLTAPICMPTRIAMGLAAWWEPPVAVLLTAAGIAALVVLGGRVYRGAILHTGQALRLRDAWTRATPADSQSTRSAAWRPPRVTRSIPRWRHHPHH